MGRVTRMLMPQGGASSKVGRSWELKWIQGSRAIAPYNIYPRGKILHRTTRRDKFHREIVVGDKLMCINKILDEV